MLVRDSYTLEARFQEVKRMLFPEHLVRLSSLDFPAEVPPPLSARRWAQRLEPFHRYLLPAARGSLVLFFKGKEEEQYRDVP